MRRQAWRLSGDAYAVHPGDKPWISEMYGYSFGAAKADVWHKYHHHSHDLPRLPAHWCAAHVASLSHLNRSMACKSICWDCRHLLLTRPM